MFPSQGQFLHGLCPLHSPGSHPYSVSPQERNWMREGKCLLPFPPADKGGPFTQKDMVPASQAQGPEL